MTFYDLPALAADAPASEIRARIEWLRTDLAGYEDPSGMEYDDECDALDAAEAQLQRIES